MWNLLDEPWLPMRTADGGVGDLHGIGTEEVGVRRLLLEAHRFRDLAVELPTQKPAILRQVLLPIIVDALGVPKDAAAWVRMFRAGSFSPAQREALTEYLDKYRASFDLFDPVDPFAQVADLHTTKNETKTAAVLVATTAQGNTVPLFSSRADGDPPGLTPAQAARWLLHTHCWDTGAIKTGVVGDPRAKDGKTTGNPVGPLGQLGVVLPAGRTFYETLMLNIPFGRSRLNNDLPQWRRRAREACVEDTLSCATPAWSSRAGSGLLDVWTWQSRRIRLIPEHGPDGLIRVSRAVVAAGDRLRIVPDHEPHTAWLVDSAATQAKRAKQSGRKAPSSPIRPRLHQPGRAGWRGLDALLAAGRSGEQTDAKKDVDGFHTSELLSKIREARERLPDDYPLQLELSGISYGQKLGFMDDVFFDEIPLPLTALDPDGVVYGSLLEAVGQAEELARAVNRLSADLRRAAGADPIPADKGQRPGDTLLHALDPVVRRLLIGLRTVGDDFGQSERGLEAWENRAGRETWRVAEQIFSTAPPSLFTGRTNKQDTYRLSTAERTFRKRLDKILPRRAARRKAA